MNSDNKVSSNPLILDTRNAQEISDLSEIYKDIHFIKLETNDSFLIGNIDRIVFSKNSIFILDANKARSVFSFNMSGSALAKYKFIGKGPREYIQLYDIILNSKKDNVQILADAQKIIQLTPNLEFISERLLGFRGYCFASVSEQNFYFQSETQTGELLISDGLFDIKERQFVLPNPRNVYSGFPFSTFKDIVFFNRFRCDTIFSIQGKSVIPSRILELKVPGSLFRYDECDAFSFIQTNSSLILYFKSSDAAYVINRDTNDDLFHLPFRSIRYIGFYDGKLIATIEPISIMQNMEIILRSMKQLSEPIRNSMAGLIDGLSASQNPILLLIDVNKPD